MLLVTGRILDELRRVAGDLHFVDGVIAENGAVIHFPDSGRTSALALPVPEGFVAELRRLLRVERGLPRDRLSISGYWRIGADEEGWRAAKAAWNAAAEELEQRAGVA